MLENRHCRRRIAREGLRAHMATPPSASRVFFVLLALLALTIQTLVVQSHIHIRTLDRRISANVITLAHDVAPKVAVQHATIKAPSPRDRYPIREDPANCPLCQEVAHSGQFVQSSVILAILPFAVTVSLIVFDEALPSFLTVSHIWQGRAPPKA
jgi:hypothetical protein